MKNTRKVTSVLVLLAMCAANAALAFTPQRLTVEQKRADFTQLINQIKFQYAPKDYKREVLGIDLHFLANDYWERIKASKTNGEFYALISQFVAEFQDGHFGAWIPSTVVASLPFTVTRVEGHILLEFVDREELSEEDFPFAKGDELVAMDGRPVSAIVDELATFKGTGNPETLIGLASEWLTWRRGRFLPVPEGPVDVTILPRDGSGRQTVTLEWIIDGTPFDEYRPLAAATAQTKMLSRALPPVAAEESLFAPMNLSSRDLVIGDHPYAEESYHCSGTTRIQIPEEATVLMETPFVAYYHPTPHGNVGYLRIPHYYPEAFGEGSVTEMLLRYEWALTHLQANTVGLIVDQDHNCGGSVEYLEDLVGLFMSQPYSGTKFQIRASKFEILDWESWLQGLGSENFLLADGLHEVIDLIKETHSQGEYLTPMTAIRGSPLLPPRGVYTKPIVILTDLMSGSGGDAFPALMQGFGRATILGTRTMGLGGYVRAMDKLTYSQIQSRMTHSLFFHPNGTAIENNGVTPDIEYRPTVNDFLNEYVDYQQFYLNALFARINK